MNQLNKIVTFVQSFEEERSMDIELERIGLKIPAELKTRLKINAAKNKIPYKDIITPLIEQYLITENRKKSK